MFFFYVVPAVLPIHQGGAMRENALRDPLAGKELGASISTVISGKSGAVQGN